MESLHKCDHVIHVKTSIELKLFGQFCSCVECACVCELKSAV